MSVHVNTTSRLWQGLRHGMAWVGETNLQWLEVLTSGKFCKKKEQLKSLPPPPHDDPPLGTSKDPGGKDVTLMEPITSLVPVVKGGMMTSCITHVDATNIGTTHVWISFGACCRRCSLYSA